MTRDEITLMAREAGIALPAGPFPERGSFTLPELLNFARTVADKARHTPGTVSIATNVLEQERARGYRQGMAAEREACAQASEQQAKRWPDYRARYAASECAAAIRQRAAA